jgi:hypothetical protein
MFYSKVELQTSGYMSIEKIFEQTFFSLRDMGKLFSLEDTYIMRRQSKRAQYNTNSYT